MQPVAKIWPAMRYEAPSCPARRASSTECTDAPIREKLSNGRLASAAASSSFHRGELDLFYTETLCHIEEAVKDTGNLVAFADRQDVRRERFIGAFVQVLFAQDQGGGLEGADPLHLLEKGPGAKRSIGNRDDGAIIRRHSRFITGWRAELLEVVEYFVHAPPRRKSRIGRRPLLRSRPSVRQSPLLTPAEIFVAAIETRLSRTRATFPRGDGDAGKRHQKAVGHHHLQKLRFMDVHGIDLIVVDDRAEAGAGEGDFPPPPPPSSPDPYSLA